MANDFKHFWCNEFPAFPENSGNSSHQKCQKLKVAIWLELDHSLIKFNNPLRSILNSLLKKCIFYAKETTISINSKCQFYVRGLSITTNDISNDCCLKDFQKNFPIFFKLHRRQLVAMVGISQLFGSSRGFKQLKHIYNL